MSNFSEIVLVKDNSDRLLVRQAPFCTYLYEGEEVIVEDDTHPYSVKAVVLDRISLDKNDEVYRFLLRSTKEKDFMRVLRRISYQDLYKDPDGYWYGIYTGLLGFMVNTDELERLGLEVPQTWDDLLKPEYKGLIWLSNYKTAGTPKLVANLMIQLKGHDEGIQYLVDLDKNVQVYTKSGSGPSKNVGTGECVIGIGFLHDGITQIVDNGYENVKLVVPQDGTACEIGPVAIFKGAAHINAARLFLEYALSPDCVELAAENGSYQFLVIDNAEQPAVAADFGLDPSLVWDGYDFAAAKEDTDANVEAVMAAIEAAGADTGADRFKTE